MVDKKVCVIGLGYVGLPLAFLCARKGYDVYGYDSSERKVSMINRGLSPIDDLKEVYGVKASTDERIIKEASNVIICVPTPVDDAHHPDLKPIISATDAISRNLKHSSLVCLESTVNSGVTEEIVKPILDKKYVDGVDYFLAHCPERINPGDKYWNVENLPRNVGATTPRGLELAYDFYSSILTAKVMRMSTVKGAEMTKIVENSFRDVNIAFVNELARVCDKMGIDLMEVLEGAGTKPYAFLKHTPGCGVGGHCIAVDPHYQIEQGTKVGFDHRLLKVSRLINDDMPHYTANLVADELNKLKLPVNGTTIGVLGLAYKAGVGDIRESPALVVVDDLRKKEADLKIFDPHIPEKSNATLEEVLNSKCIVLLTNHQEFLKLDYSKAEVVIDGRNCLDKDKNKIKKYKGIGR